MRQYEIYLLKFLGSIHNKVQLQYTKTQIKFFDEMFFSQCKVEMVLKISANGSNASALSPGTE